MQKLRPKYETQALLAQLKSLTSKIKIMIAYRTTITRCVALATLIGCSTLACKGGRVCQEFEAALALDTTSGANKVKEMIDSGRIRIDCPIGPRGWFSPQRTPLHIAAREGAVNTVQLMIDRCKSANIDIANLKDRDGSTPLHLAARNGKWKVAEKLMEAAKELATARDNEGYMALHRALEKHLPERVETDSEAFMALPEAVREAYRVLHRALREHLPAQVEAVREAYMKLRRELQKYAQRQPKVKADAEDNMALHRVLQHLPEQMEADAEDNMALRRVLQEHLAKQTEADSEGNMALHRVLQEHALKEAGTARGKLVSCLLPTDFPENTVSKMVIARVKVQEGKNPKQRGRGYAAVHLAAQNGTLEAMLYILGQGGGMLKLDNLGKNDCTLLHLAVKGNQSEIVIKLLKKAIELLKKAEVRKLLVQPDQEGCTWLHYVNACPSIEEVLKTLKDSCEKFILEDSCEESTLEDSCEDPTFFRTLLSNPNNDGHSPLHRAIIEGLPKVVKLLVEEGADVNAQDKSGCTPLDLLRNRLATTPDSPRKREAITEIEEYLLSKNAKFRQSEPQQLQRIFQWLAENLLELSQHTTVAHSVGPIGPTTTVTVNDPFFMLRKGADASSSSRTNRSTR